MPPTRIRKLALIFARCGAIGFSRWVKRRSIARAPAGKRGGRLALPGLALLLLAPGASSGGVISDSDMRKVEAIKPLFVTLMGDLVQTSKRTDISSADAECVRSTIRELMQISDELSSYEYLITMEKDMTDFGDHNPMQDVVKFAIDKSNAILTSERKRLVQLSDQCTRFPVSSAKTQEALQFIDTTTGILQSIHPRL
jgi:hypothetical protein